MYLYPYISPASPRWPVGRGRVHPKRTERKSTPSTNDGSTTGKDTSQQDTRRCGLRTVASRGGGDAVRNGPPGHRPPPRSSAPTRVSPGRPPAGAQRVDRRARPPGSIRSEPHQVPRSKASPGPRRCPRRRTWPHTSDPLPGRSTRTARSRGRTGPASTRPPDPKLDAPSSGLSQIKAASGLRSVARNNKATRLRTRPGRSTKSSAKDLSLRTVKLQSASRGAPFRGTPHRQPAVVRGRSLFVSDCGVQGRITPFRHGF